MPIFIDVVKKSFFNFNNTQRKNNICSLLSKPIIITLIGMGFLYLYLFGAFFILFNREPIGTDTVLWNHFASYSYSYTSSPIDLSVISPVQGLGGLIPPIGVWLNPAYFLPHFFAQYMGQHALAFLVTSIMLSAAFLILCLITGLSTPLSVFATQIFTIIFFFPCDVLNTQSLTLVPQTVTPIALGTILVAVFFFLGNASYTKNLIAFIILPVLVLHAVLCNPPYTIVFFAPLVIFGCGILIGSETRRIFFCRLIGVFIILIFTIFIDLPRFYSALQGYTAKSVFPNEIYAEVQDWSYTSFSLQNFQNYYSAVTAGFLIFCCLLAIIFGSQQEKTFVFAVLFFFVLIVCTSLLFIYGGIRWNIPMPDYFEWGAHAGYAVAAFIGIQIGWRKTKCSLLLLLQKATGCSYTPIFRIFLIYICLLVVPPLLIARMVNPFLIKDCINGKIWRKLKSQVCVENTSNPIQMQVSQSKGPLIDYLEEELAISPGEQFRGSVATLIGVPGGSVARQLGYADDAPYAKSNIVNVPKYLQETLSPFLCLTGLWNLGIPTLEDNSSLVTPPFHFLFSRALSRPHDFHSRNWCVITKLHPRLMAALGTRFVLTDEDMEEDLLILRATQTNADGVAIRLYEIMQPNLASYSPTTVRISRNALETIGIMTSNDFSFKDDAILHNEEFSSIIFVPAESGAMFFEKGGVRIKASSKGRSLLVLPLQFSNALKILSMEQQSKSNVLPKLLRVNLLQTGVLFEGEINIKIAHVFGLFRGVDGRFRDIQDCKDLCVKETGEIPYPPDYQPYSKFHWDIHKYLNR